MGWKSWKEDLARVGAGAATGGLSEVAYQGKKYLNEKDANEAKKAANTDAANKAAVVSKQSEGRARAENLYGATESQTGDINKRVISERTNALNEVDPVSTRIKQGANASLRAARASAQSSGKSLSSGEQAQIARTAESDTADALYANKQTNLDAYARMGGTLASNTLSTEMGFGGLGTASQTPYLQQAGVTIICTELHRQGYLSDDIMEADAAHGSFVRNNDPFVYLGYIYIARPIVSLMKKSKLFAKLVSIFGVSWAHDMAGKKNLLGKIINKVGTPICRIIGKVRNERYKKIYC